MIPAGKVVRYEFLAHEDPTAEVSRSGEATQSRGSRRKQIRRKDRPIRQPVQIRNSALRDFATSVSGPTVGQTRQSSNGRYRMDRNIDFGVSIDSYEQELALRSASTKGDGFGRTVKETFERVARRRGKGGTGYIGWSVRRIGHACSTGLSVRRCILFHIFFLFSSD